MAIAGMTCISLVFGVLSLTVLIEGILISKQTNNQLFHLNPADLKKSKFRKDIEFTTCIKAADISGIAKRASVIIELNTK